jgi:hypothetical protein
MQRLPFNPEPLLALFMTKENTGSLAGDLVISTSKAECRKGFDLYDAVLGPK